MLDEMTQTTVDAGGEFLEHYGVKGMKWGYRKDRKRAEFGGLTRRQHQRAKFGGGTRKERRADSKQAKSDNKGLNVKRKERSAAGDGQKRGLREGWQADKQWLHSNTSKVVAKGSTKGLSDLRKLHKARYGGRDMTKAPTSVQARYNKDAARLLTTAMNQEANALGTSPTGKIAIRAMALPDGTIMVRGRSSSAAGRKIETATALTILGSTRNQGLAVEQSSLTDEETLVHASQEEIDLAHYQIKFDSKGLAIGVEEIKMSSGTLEQSAVDAGGDFLAHYGVKGMKWGHRMSDAERRARREKREGKRAIARARREDRKDRRQAARLDRKKTESQIKAQAEAQAKIEKVRARAERKLAETTNSGQNGSNQGPKGDSNDIVGKSKRESKKLRKEAAKNARQINDADIEAYTKRLQKERQMKDLITQDTAPRQAATKDFVSSVGKTVLTTAAVAAGSYAVGAALNKGGWPDLAKAASGGKWKPGDAKDSIDKATKTAKDTPIDLGKYKLPPDTFPKRPPAPFPPPPTYKPPKTRLPPPPKRLLAPDGKPFRR